MVVRIALPSYSTGTFYRVLQSVKSAVSDPQHVAITITKLATMTVADAMMVIV